MTALQTKRPISILTIGTEILTKDLMDQYLRTLGDISTYYGSRMEMAIEAFEKYSPNIIFCEKDFSDGSVQQFVTAIGGLQPDSRTYFVMAARDSIPELVALGKELGADEVLAKPFNAEKIHAAMERAVQKLEGPKPAWAVEIGLALESVRLKRFHEAEVQYKRIEQQYTAEPEVNLALAKFYFSKADWKKSLECLERIGGAKSQDPRILTILGRLSAKQNNWNEAMSYWLDAQRLSPFNTERLHLLADAHVVLAQELSKQICRIDEFDCEAHITIVKAQAFRRQYGDALSYAERKQSHLGVALKEAAAYTTLVKQLGKLK